MNASFGRDISMSDFWKQCEGQMVGAEFRLLQMLGPGEHGAVFLAERDGDKNNKFAVKLLREISTDGDLQLARWKGASKIAHPLLLKIVGFGRCEMAGQPLVFVATEYAEESLSEILPQRALSASEALDMARPVVEALRFIHNNSLVHGCLKPANVLAVGDRLKLSSDGMCPIGERLLRSKPSLYIAPEMVNGDPAAPPSDVWALGVTLTEALTQSLPVWNSSGHEDPTLPKPLPAPFDVIVPHCLTYDPQRRWGLAEISSHLQSPQKAKPPVEAPSKISPRKRYAIPLVVAIAATGLIAYGVLHNDGDNIATPPIVQSQPAGLPENGPQLPATPSSSAAPPSPAIKFPAHGKTLKADATPDPLATERSNEMGTVTPTEADVIHEPLPAVAPSARRTIHGRVHVSVRVDVDSSGDVSNADLESPGPSKYFARLALEASKNWKFSSAATQEGNNSRRWVLHYLFGRKDTKVSAHRLR